jgi:hypothetical protein
LFLRTWNQLEVLTAVKMIDDDDDDDDGGGGGGNGGTGGGGDLLGFEAMQICR